MRDPYISFSFYSSLFFETIETRFYSNAQKNTRPPGTGTQTESDLFHLQFNFAWNQYYGVVRSSNKLQFQFCILMRWSQQLSTCRSLCSFSFWNVIILFVWSSPTHCGLTSILYFQDMNDVAKSRNPWWKIKLYACLSSSVSGLFWIWNLLWALMRISNLVVPAWNNCMSMWDSIIEYPKWQECL